MAREDAVEARKTMDPPPPYYTTSQNCQLLIALALELCPEVATPVLIRLIPPIKFWKICIDLNFWENFLGRIFGKDFWDEFLGRIFGMIFFRFFDL